MRCALSWTDSATGVYGEPVYVLVLPWHALPRCAPPGSKAPPARLAAGVLQMCTINADVTGTCAPACSVQCSVRGPQRARLVPARACSGVEGIERWTREGGGNAALIGATLLALGMLTPHFSSAFFPG